MKKVFSILLLAVFLFNVGGYYLVFWGLRLQTDQQLSYRLDANLYDPGETIELKIPVTLPYPIQARGFERVDGRFEHNGQFYKLVKHRLHNDTLYVVCIRDYAMRELVETMTDYVQLTQSAPATDLSKEALNYLSKLVSDFYPQEDLALLHQDGFTVEVLFAERPEHFLQNIIAVLSPPPKA